MDIVLVVQMYCISVEFILVWEVLIYQTKGDLSNKI